MNIIEIKDFEFDLKIWFITQKIYNCEYHLKIWFEFYLQLKYVIIWIIFKSILLFINKSLTISTFSLCIAKYNAVL